MQWCWCNGGVDETKMRDGGAIWDLDLNLNASAEDLRCSTCSSIAHCTSAASTMMLATRRIASRRLLLQRCLLSSQPVPTGEPSLPALPIDFDVAAKIQGEESHIATIELRPGEVLRAESGAMVFMTEGVEMDTKMEGFSAAFARSMTGQNVFLTDYRYLGSESGTVCLGTDFPSKILKYSLDDHGGALICQRGAFLAGNSPSIDIQMEFTKSLTSGFFGGQGFILQKVTGEGDVLLKGGGTIVNRELKEGETLRVTSGSIVAFEPSVQYDVQMMPGIKNAMFGGEGLFVTTLKGPGRIWLQGMPPDRMISEIARRVPGGAGIPIGIGLGGGGGEGAAEGSEGVDGAAVGEGGAEEMVAATDAAVDADRQATVASSGMMGSDSGVPVDSESPEALFGDAAPKDVPVDSASPSSDNSFGATSDDPFATPDTFGNDFEETSFSADETSFSDDTTTFSSDDFSSDFEAQDGELFDDPGMSSSAPEAGGEESGGSIFSTLWDMFMGDDE